VTIKNQKKRMDEDEFLSISEAAQILGHSTVTLRRWEKQGKITSFRVGGQDGGLARPPG